MHEREARVYFIPIKKKGKNDLIVFDRGNKDGVIYVCETIKEISTKFGIEEEFKKQEDDPTEMVRKWDRRERGFYSALL